MNDMHFYQLLTAVQADHHGRNLTIHSSIESEGRCAPICAPICAWFSNLPHCIVQLAYWVFAIRYSLMMFLTPLTHHTLFPKDSPCHGMASNPKLRPCEKVPYADIMHQISLCNAAATALPSCSAGRGSSSPSSPRSQGSGYEVSNNM